MNTSLHSRPSHDAVRIPLGGGRFLDGDLDGVPNARGLVIFAHGSGSSRFSPRNRSVAHALGQDGFATLLIDLLTREEEAVDVQNARFRFDIPLLAHRLGVVADWAGREPRLSHLKIGFFGASTGAAAALVAAAQRPDRVATVVSRGGRPDLAGESLADVRCPTLLIVGGQDHDVFQFNEQAKRKLRCEAELSVIPGATHLFEEPGALVVVARRASAWFQRYLSAQGASASATRPRTTEI